MEQYTLVELVNKVFGEIEPVGDTTEDEKRVENLKKHIELIESLLNKVLLMVLRYEDDSLYSRKKAATVAKQKLIPLAKELNLYVDIYNKVRELEELRTSINEEFSVEEFFKYLEDNMPYMYKEYVDFKDDYICFKEVELG